MPSATGNLELSGRKRSKLVALPDGKITLTTSGRSYKRKEYRWLSRHRQGIATVFTLTLAQKVINEQKMGQDEDREPLKAEGLA